MKSPMCSASSAAAAAAAASPPDTKRGRLLSLLRPALSFAWKTAAALLSLYLFICSLTFLSSSFRILGGRNLSSLFEGDLLSNPVVGVMIGEEED